MMRRLRRWVLRQLSRAFSDRMSDWVARRLTRELAEELRTRATDGFLELLLRGMDVAFSICQSFRKNIENFEARYVFAAGNGKVATTADFANGGMRVHREIREPWTVRVTFASPKALRAFLFSKDQDILDSILANEVEVDGNLNYLYKFGFMARDLERRLGIA
jgi:hypothetical protein